MFLWKGNLRQSNDARQAYVVDETKAIREELNETVLCRGHKT